MSRSESGLSRNISVQPSAENESEVESIDQSENDDQSERGQSEFDESERDQSELESLFDLDVSDQSELDESDLDQSELDTLETSRSSTASFASFLFNMMRQQQAERVAVDEVEVTDTDDEVTVNDSNEFIDDEDDINEVADDEVDVNEVVDDEDDVSEIVVNEVTVDEVMVNEITFDEVAVENENVGEVVEVIAEVQTTRSNFGSAFDVDTSLVDFRPAKMSKNESKGGVEAGGGDSGDEGENCPICFEPWTNSGSHRLASLKCGHLFGKSCIMKWLKGNPGKCPHCNTRAHCRDVRVLFARTVKMLDTSERDRAIQDLEREKEARKKAELEAARIRLNHQMALAECNQLKEELERQKQQMETMRKITCHGQQKQGTNEISFSQEIAGSMFILKKNVKISEAGGCRVMAYCSTLNTLCVSQPSSSPLFPGFGIKKIETVDFKPVQYISIHTKAIRDLSFSKTNQDSFLLSCSIDKTIKITNLQSNKVIHSYECSVPVWSCTWNLDDKNYFFAGQQNGTVVLFDTRNLSQCVTQMTIEGSWSPVVSLQYLPRMTGNQFRSGGLLVGQLDRSAFYERCSTASDYKLHLLPLEANLISLSLEENSGHMLATYRPTGKHPYIRHQVSQLVMEPVHMSDDVNNDDGTSTIVCNCNVIHTFHSGSTQKLLARSRLLLQPESDRNMLACSGDEASSSFHIWNASTGQLQQKISSTDPVIDLCLLNAYDQSHLVALTEKQMSVYTYQSSFK